MLKNISAITIALVFLLFQGGQATAAQKMLEDINFESTGNGEERIIFKLNGTYIPQIFTLQGKQPRVVFDFKDTGAAKMINNIINTNGELIRRIRVGIHKGDNPKTRVVLDLRPNKNINIRQDFDKEDKSLIISVHYAGSKQNNEEKEAVEQTDVKEKNSTVKATPPVQPEEKQKVAAKTEEKNTPVIEKKERLEQESVPKKKEEKLEATPAREVAEQAPKNNDMPSSPSGIPTLTSVTFDNNSNRGEMVLFRLNEFHPPIVFGIEEGAPRVVCDFKNTAAAENLPDSLKTGGKYIQKVRVGKNKKEKKVRVVLDLVPNYSYDLQQVFFKEENLFVIIINTLGNAPTGDPSDLLK